MPVVRHDAGERDLERLAEVGVDPLGGLLDLRGRHPQPRRDVHPVGRSRAPNDRGVALGPHLGQDARHGIVHVGAGRVGAREGRVVRRRGAAEVQDTEGHEAPRLPGCPGRPSRSGGRRA